jgi:hypothetical protein
MMTGNATLTRSISPAPASVVVNGTQLKRPTQKIGNRLHTNIGRLTPIGLRSRNVSGSRVTLSAFVQRWLEVENVTRNEPLLGRHYRVLSNVAWSFHNRVGVAESKLTPTITRATRPSTSSMWSGCVGSTTRNSTASTRAGSSS